MELCEGDLLTGSVRLAELLTKTNFRNKGTKMIPRDLNIGFQCLA